MSTTPEAYAVTVTVTLEVHAPNEEAAMYAADEAMDNLAFHECPIEDYRYTVHDGDTMDPPQVIRYAREDNA